jgi:hypothetical protein
MIKPAFTKLFDVPPGPVVECPKCGRCFSKQLSLETHRDLTCPRSASEKRS